MVKRVATLLVTTLAVATVASAQSSTSGGSQTSTQQSGGTSTSSTAGSRQTGASTPPPMSGEVETRPATTTVNGDTGLWFVPTGEVLPAKKWSLSAYRVNFDRDQGFTDVSDWPATFGFGLGIAPRFSGRGRWCAGLI